MRMKRFNLVLDEELVERVRQITGERTYAGAVMKALSEMDRLERLRTGLERIHGRGWDGDLDEMRTSLAAEYEDRQSRGTRIVADAPVKRRRAPRR